MVIRKIKLPDGNTYDLPGGGTGSGDMEKSVYDYNDDGIVNASDVADTVSFGQYNIEFGIDDRGNYGYKQYGSSIVTPFDISTAYRVKVTTRSEELFNKPLTVTDSDGVLIVTEVMNPSGVTIILPAAGIYTFTVTY